MSDAAVTPPPARFPPRRRPCPPSRRHEELENSPNANGRPAHPARGLAHTRGCSEPLPGKEKEEAPPPPPRPVGPGGCPGKPTGTQVHQPPPPRHTHTHTPLHRRVRTKALSGKQVPTTEAERTGRHVVETPKTHGRAGWRGGARLKAPGPPAPRQEEPPKGPQRSGEQRLALNFNHSSRCGSGASPPRVAPVPDSEPTPHAGSGILRPPPRGARRPPGLHRRVPLPGQGRARFPGISRDPSGRRAPRRVGPPLCTPKLSVPLLGPQEAREPYKPREGGLVSSHGRAPGV